MAYSGQSKIAFDHGFNDALFGRDRNNPYDISVVGKSHKAYEEGYELGLISDQPPRGPRGEDGEDGARGQSGPTGGQGQDGTDGDDGTDMLTGSGAPAGGLGTEGDIYIDADTGEIYEKTGPTTWTLQGPGGGVGQSFTQRYFLGQ